jgi:hypothetical protein
MSNKAAKIEVCMTDLIAIFKMLFLCLGKNMVQYLKHQI